MLRGKGKPQPPNKSGKPGKEDTEPAIRAPRTLDAPHRTAPGGQLSSTFPAPHIPRARANGHQGRDQPGTANSTRESNRSSQEELPHGTPPERKVTSNPARERDPPGTANPARESNRSPQEELPPGTPSAEGYLQPHEGTSSGPGAPIAWTSHPAGGRQAPHRERL